jgi:hypothetical protein
LPYRPVVEVWSPPPLLVPAAGRWTRAQQAAQAALWRGEGMSYPQIARRLGCTTQRTWVLVNGRSEDRRRSSGL